MLLILDKINTRSVKKILGFILPLVFTIFFLLLAFQNVDLKKSIWLITNTSLPWLLVFIFIFFFSHFIRAIRWKIIINSIKKETSLLNLFSAVMIGYGVGCVASRLGEVYRGFFLGRWEKLSRTSMFATVVVERIIDMLALGFSCVVSIYIYSGDLLNEVIWLKASLIVAFSVMAVFIALIYLLIVKKESFYNAIVKFVGRFSHKMADFLAKTFTTLLEGFSSIKGIKSYLLILVYSVIIMLLYALNAYIGFYILELENTYTITFGMAWVLMTISAFGVVIPTPGATGSYHLITIFVLTQLYNFNYTESGAYAILTHFISYVSFIVSSLLLLYVVNRRNFKKGIPKENFLSVFRLNMDEK
ncbi:lysylphosphatidylglycerol synthase transmembrane domain-containing protein [Melioribacteraceae bacterium 4301-Me]|uniref:lysylphosphatidylglycerol synthase transmembrane domain-containing protein n=1 Tax=Pyranulibacter aquaticus TaxID=3163344 RepID=UPI0035958666